MGQQGPIAAGRALGVAVVFGGEQDEQGVIHQARVHHGLGQQVLAEDLLDWGFTKGSCVRVPVEAG